MARGPMTALLGVLALAGYQNRDKIREILKGLTESPETAGTPGAPAKTGGLGDILGNLTGSGGGFGGLSDLLRGGAGGSILSGGLGGILDQFRQNGQAEKAQSWVQHGPNADIDDKDLSTALGADVLDELQAKTGLTREEILSRLSRDLPKAVDDLTPDGRIPDDDGILDTPHQSVPGIRPAS